MKLFFSGCMGGVIPQVVDFLRIVSQIEELAVWFTDKVDQFPVLGTRHRHVFGGQSAVAAVLGKDSFPSRPVVAF